MSRHRYSVRLATQWCWYVIWPWETDWHVALMRLGRLEVGMWCRR